jgi:hypothetical protein
MSHYLISSKKISLVGVALFEVMLSCPWSIYIRSRALLYVRMTKVRLRVFIMIISMNSHLIETITIPIYGSLNNVRKENCI